MHDHENPAPENWGTPPNYDRSDGCTFEGWNFSPSALIGMSVCGLAPHVVTAAIETSLCAAQGASALAPAFAAGPLIACVAVAGVALVVFDAQQKIITRILKAAEHIKNTITSYISQKISQCLSPQEATAVPETHTESEEIPEGNCGSSGALCDTEKHSCGAGSHKDPDPYEHACNSSKSHNLPSFTDAEDKIICPPKSQSEGSEEDKEPKKEEAETEEAEEESGPEEKEPAEKPVDESETDVSPRPTDLDRIDTDPKKKGHIIEGSKGHDHQLELVAPDKTWEQIRPIIEEVMNSGEQGNDLTDDGVRCRFKYINHHPVVVKYKEGASINYIGTIFIPTTNTINGYIPMDKQQ